MQSNNLVVFGNPPYQEMDGGYGKSAKPIYHLFVESIIDNLNPRYLSFIIPSRWMAGGMGLTKFRKRMMGDKRMRSIKHYPGQSDVFKAVLIKGGVNYFLWDRECEGKCDFNGVSRNLDEYDIILIDNKAVPILDKVLTKGGDFLNKKVLPRKPFGIASNSKDFKSTGIPCYTKGKERKFVDPSSFTDTHGVKDSWKVCTSKAINPNKEGNFHKFNSLFLAEPGTICSETYLVLGSLGGKAEAENLMSYVSSRMARFLLGLRVNAQNVSRDKFSWVPDMKDYSKNWTDEELYKIFGLTNEEIEYIESKIKEI